MLPICSVIGGGSSAVLLAFSPLGEEPRERLCRRLEISQRRPVASLIDGMNANAAPSLFFFLCSLSPTDVCHRSTISFPISYSNYQSYISPRITPLLLLDVVCVCVGAVESGT